MADAAVETTTLPATDDLHQLALKQFGAMCRAQQEERAESLQDRRFVSIAGAQWEGDWGAQFANSIQVEVNKMSQGIEKIINDYRSHRYIVNFRPHKTTDKAASESAETLNRLFMADVYRSKGQQAFDGAFEEAVAGGMGAWRLCNEYVDEYDPDEDSQCISFKWIPDADQSVFFDMDARLYDKSDAKYCFVITAMSPAQYKEDYDDDPASWPQDILKTYFDWYTPEIVRVAEYYRVVEKTHDRLWLEHTMTGDRKKVWSDELEPGELAAMKVKGWRQTGKKAVKRRAVEKHTFSAAGIIAETQMIAGDQIPVVPVYGKRSFIDNMERFRGHVRFGKDQARVYNAMVSKMVETSSITPIERPIFTPEQIAGHETSWAEANINRAPYSLINTTFDANGNPMPPAPLSTLTPPQLPPVTAALMQIAANDINELTNNQDQSDETKSNVSYAAMDMAATRTDAKSFIYTDNFRQSMQRCGEIYESMAGDIYVEDGREVPTMDPEGQQGTATLRQATVTDDGQVYLANDFSSVKFGVMADVSEATATRRDKTVRALLATAQTAAPFDPQLAAAALGVAVMNMDGEGVDDFQEWQRLRLVQQGVVKPTDEEKRQMDQAQAQQQQQPDPQAQVAQAMTEKEQALKEKAEAQTEQVRAQTVKVVAETHAGHVRATAEADAAPVEAALKQQAHRVSLFEKLSKAFTGMANSGAQ